MSVYAPIVGHIWATLESYGIDPREVIDADMYRPDDPTLTSRRIPFSDYEATIARAVARIGDPALGVRSTRCFHPSYIGALGHAWMASHDLRSAMHRAARLRRMFNEQIQLDIEETPGRVRLVYRMLEPIRAADIVGDAHVANLLQLGRIHFGSRLMPLDVTLTRPEPDDPSPWIEHFGPVIRFGQPDHSFTLRAEDADQPLTGSNPELVAIHEEVIDRYLMKLDRDSVVNRMRLELMDALPSGRVTEDDMAGVLNMSKRTLHRKLRDQGMTFRTVLTDVRQGLAQRYVKDQAYSMTEIAFMLGYNDTSAFSRAFRNWFGHSPSEARETAVAG